MAEFEARIRAQGVPFAIHPGPGAKPALDARYPVVYREPQADNDAILGLDLSSEAVRRAAIVAAATSRMPTVSDPIHLLEKRKSQIGMLCFQPVFVPAAGGSRARPPALQGFVVALVRIRPLIDRALAFRADEPEAVLSELYQLRADGPPALLAAADRGDIEPVPVAAPAARPATVFPVFFLGKTYGVALRPGPGFDAGYPQRAGWAVVLVGLLATAAASGLTGLTISRRRGLEQGVRERTWRLDSILRGTRAGTWEWTLQSGAVEINDRWAEIVGFTRHELEPISLETWKSLCHPEDLERSTALMLAHLRGEVDYYDCECRMRHKAGHWVWV